MAAKTYNLNFSDYVWQENLPERAGIYLTYTVKHDLQTGKHEIDELVYIGESVNIKDRQKQHFADGDYPHGALLAFAYALMPDPEASRIRCESAMIFYIRPRWNRRNTQSFNYDTTTVNSSGNPKGVPSTFTVYRTP